MRRGWVDVGVAKGLERDEGQESKGEMGQVVVGVGCEVGEGGRVRACTS